MESVRSVPEAFSGCEAIADLHGCALKQPKIMGTSIGQLTTDNRLCRPRTGLSCFCFWLLFLWVVYLAVCSKEWTANMPGQQ